LYPTTVLFDQIWSIKIDFSIVISFNGLIKNLPLYIGGKQKPALSI
jgi:hypothetical protein